MLKKNDLVKQFSLVVKQEIKNHQDSILATNIAINSINERINKMSAHFSSKFNEIDQYIKLQEVNQQRLDKSFIDNRDKTLLAVNRIENICKKISVAQESLAHKVSECQKAEVDIYKRLAKAFDFNIKQDEDIENLYKHIDNETNRLKLDISKESKRIKKEILDIPSGIEVIKEDLNNKIQSYRIDSEGIVRELAIFKKTIYVIGKEIENVNIQIERLKIKTIGG